MRFPYYARLSKRGKAIYRESDEWGAIELELPSALAPTALSIGDALRCDDRIEVERLSRRLVSGICTQLNVDPPSTRVLALRPRSSESELHGLYVREEEKCPVLMVWMRTAARGQPVAHRTFVRTLLHEVCHHLDFDLLDLADSYHTHGFFARESSLQKQLMTPARKAGRKVARQPASLPTPEASQLDLPF